MNRSFLTCNPTFKGVNRDLPLPPNISTDKNAILDILHNHHLIARISWPDFEIKSVESRLNATIFTFRLKSSIATITHQARLTNVDDGVVIYEKPEPGITSQVEWILAKGKNGFTLEEHYVVEGSWFMWLDTKVYGGHQPQTMLLLWFSKKIAWEASANKAKQLKLNPDKSKD